MLGVMQFRSAAASDRGLVREDNEDRLLCDDGQGLYGVADGIGGLPYGERAASMAVEEFSRLLGLESDIDAARLAQVLASVNQGILQLGQSLSPLRGLGTTFCAGTLRRDLLLVGNLGDSRAYLLREGRLQPITRDHNLENDAAARIARGEYVLLTERTKGALTRCLGQPGMLEPDVFPVALKSGDRVLFCTDGVYRPVPDRELESLIANSPTPQEGVETLVKLSKERGGYDNATAVLLFAD